MHFLKDGSLLRGGDNFVGKHGQNIHLLLLRARGSVFVRITLKRILATFL